MGFLDGLRRLFGGKVAEPAEGSFEDSEQAKARELSELYDDQRDETLRSALEVLESSMLESDEPEPEAAPVEFDAGEADADDLLSDDPLIDHYKMAMGDAVDPNSADAHLTAADVVSSDGTDMSAYEQVEVPVGSDEEEDSAKAAEHDSTEAEGSVAEDDAGGVEDTTEQVEAGPSPAQMKRMKKAELVELAESRGLDSNGTKADILSRLNA